MSVIIMLAIIAVIGVILLIILTTGRGHGKILDKEKYRTDWLELENNISDTNEATYQFAILSADKLLDRALRESGVSGKTMGDRLKNSKSLLPNIEAVWAAHKIRNKIAHEVGKDINRAVAKRMLAVYKAALKDLGAI